MSTSMRRRLGLMTLAALLFASLFLSGFTHAATAEGPADTTASEEAPSPEPSPSADPATEPSAEPSSESAPASTDAPASGTSQDAAPTEDAPAEEAPANEAPAGQTTATTQAERTSAEPNARAAACTPRDRSSEANLEVSLDKQQVSAWDWTRVSFSGTLPDGSCAGDTVVVGIPSELAVRDGSFPVRNAAGVSLGTMTVDATSRTATFTFNDFVEKHNDIRFRGWLSSQYNDTIEPGEPYDLTWPVGNTTVVTPITTNPCPECDGPRTTPLKWGTVVGEWVWVGLESAHLDGKTDPVTFTDKLGPGQELDCSTVAGYNATRNQWGALERDESRDLIDVTCDKSGFTATINPQAGDQYVTVVAGARVTDPSRESYSDEGTVTQSGKTTPVEATAVRYAGGAEGDGNVPPSPPVTPPTPPTESEVLPPMNETPAAAPAASSQTAAGALPATGSPASLVPMAALGAALIPLGLLLIASQRRRNNEA